jgi:DNA ligase (NAD+)
MNIEGIGESTIEDLYHHGVVQSIPDFFALEKMHDAYCRIDGFGEKSWKKLVQQFNHLEATEAEILSSLAIQMLGPANSKRVTAIYHLSDLLEMADYPEKVAVDEMVRNGLPRKVSENTIKGVKENARVIEFLMKQVRIKKVKTGNSTLNNFVFTGFRNASFKSFLESELDIHVSDSVTKATMLVIAEDPNGKSGKLTKARDMGIPVISVPEAYEKFGFKI